MQIQGRTFLVTGGSRGIGRALAATLIDAGAKVLIAARTAAALEEAAAELAARAQAVPGAAVASLAGDVGEDEAAAAIVRRTVEEHGSLDVLVNNAAVLTQPAPIGETPPAVWDEVLRVNVTGTANMIRHALPVMRAQGHGVFVNVSSTWGRLAAPGVAPYCASKFAVEALTQSLAAEVPGGIVAVALNPGVIATEMLARAFERDVDAYPPPAALGPRWLRFFETLESDWNGRSVDLMDF